MHQILCIPDVKNKKSLNPVLYFILWDFISESVPYNLVFLFNVDPGFFLCNVGEICALLAQYLQQPVTITKMVFRRHCTGVFLCNVVWSLLGNNVQGFYLCNIVPRVLQQHWTAFFLCAILSGASSTTLHKVFTCSMLSKSIKTTLDRIFSCALLSWASWTTLYKVFAVTCAMLS